MRSADPPLARGRRLHYSRRIQLWGFSFVLPTLLFFAVFKYGPMMWAVELSFTSYDMVSPPRFVGLENFVSWPPTRSSARASSTPSSTSRARPC